MTRRKSDLKRTLVLVVFVCPFVFSRPQESLATSISYAETTESPLRYRFRVDSSRALDRVPKSGNFYNTSFLQYIALFIIDQFPWLTQTNRTNRLLRKSFKTKQNRIKSNSVRKSSTPKTIKPVIKKVITKWTDNVKDDNLEFSREDEDNKSDSIIHNYYTSTEINDDINEHISDKRYSPNNYPQSQYSEETHIYSSNFQVIDKHPYASPTRPSFIYSKPTPTPIITNVGYPPPWHDRYHSTQKPSTVKPIKYTKPPYNNYPNYPNNFEVTTFPPTTGYTDRIVIRPEEYAATSNDCPTIFLTLNNTFQGQGKEACPDLNIAVNTNVVNKNVVVESEEDTDSTLTDIFGLPDGNSESEESSNNYSDENEEDESVAIESLELSNYNSANDGIQAESAEYTNFAQQSSPISALSRPTKDDEDDGFGLSSIISFFRPAISAFSWLASINPLSFPALSFILTPIILLVASTSGIAALFAPWVLTYARQAPDIGFYGPQRRWIDNYETWNSNSAYNNWKQRRMLSRSTNLNVQNNVTRNRQAWYNKLKQWMTTVREILNNRKQSVKRKKRNIITYYKKVTPVVTEKQNAYSPSIGVPVAALESTPREVKNKSPAIKDSIKKVADQLLETAVNNSLDTPLVPDTRIPPKIKTQVVQKSKIRTRNEDGDEINDYSHAGVAVPVSMEELELENRVSPSHTESSTSNEGISTWILLNNPVNKENSTLATEPTKIEENKKSKPTKNKPKRPQNKPSTPKRPIIGSTNKSDLVASGSAINENVYNKIKDTVLTNVQKNKNSPPRAASTTTTTTTSTTEAQVKEITYKEQGPIIAVMKVPSKSNKKKDKLKHKSSTTLAPVSTQSALLPLEAKEQEIELEVSTPPSTTKKPKRSSTKKKTKTKKRKVSKPKPTQTSSSTELKTANKTKTTKTSKKPTKATGPFTSQIYNYFSREVMPSVGVGVIGLAGLVGIASYFLYPFATPVRRTFEVDKKDDIYKNNAEEYANEGNGQPEEEMLGTVLAGMPAHAKQKLNPYAAQTNYNARYPAKKEQQDIRYRHVTKYDPNYGVHYPQQKTGIAHGAVYSEPLNYHRRPQYETRHAYTTSYPAVEPIFAAPQTGPSDATPYGSESSGSVVYGVKPSADTDFKPVYPYDPQFYGETTTSPVTYSQTSMYLGSNNESEQSEDIKYNDDSNSDTESGENKFVVGNVPKELSDSDTPAVVPEHGPRKLNRKRRSLRLKRGVAIEEILEAANKKEKEVFLSNEIDEALGYVSHIPQSIELLPIKTEEKYNYIIPIQVVNPSTELKGENSKMGEIVESVSTIPIEDSNDKTTDMSNDIEITTKSNTEKNLQADTTTDIKFESTSTMSTVSKTTKQPTDFPEILTYPPPSSSNGFFGFLQRLVEFKYRLGLSILQSTSKSLNNYLRSMEETIQRAASDASH